MGDDRLIERRPSSSDRRSIVILPTDHAQHLLSSFGHGIAEVIGAALQHLTAREARQLIAAVPALTHLDEDLQTIVETAEAGVGGWRGGAAAPSPRIAG